MYGSCWFLTKDYFENCLGGMSSVGYDTFGMEPPELCLKTWLGPWDGKVMVNKHCWYAHMHKGGQRPINGILKNTRDYLEMVPRRGGFYLQEGTHEEIPAITYMAAAGVNIIVFATGRGGVFGHAICPVIRVTGNPETCI